VVFTCDVSLRPIIFGLAQVQESLDYERAISAAFPRLCDHVGGSSPREWFGAFSRAVSPHNETEPVYSMLDGS
jgi:hypothetical protein